MSFLLMLAHCSLSSMERKNLNLEFTTKLNTGREELYPKYRGSRHLIVKSSLMASSSGGDIKMNGMHISHHSRNPSFHQLSYEVPNNSNDGEEEDLRSEISNDFDLDRSSLDSQTMTSKLKAELAKYKKELREYTHTTKDLEHKYHKINFELNEIQQKHNRFVAGSQRCCTNSADSDDGVTDDISSTGSEYSLKRKYTQVFDRDPSFMHILSRGSDGSLLGSGRSCDGFSVGSCRRHTPHQSRTTVESCLLGDCNCRSKQRLSDDKENEPLGDITNDHHHRMCNKDLNDIYKTLKTVMEGNHQKIANHQQEVDIGFLQTTIVNLQNEQEKYRSIIEQQQCCLNDYHTRCVKAQQIMHTQQIEIEKLSSNNHQLETEITSGIDHLRLKLEAKLREVAQLPQLLREEQAKHDRLLKENALLHDRIRAIQVEANQLKAKLEDINKRKLCTLTRLKAAERDLKIFKNYNAALKQEKRRLNDELQKVREEMETLQSGNKRMLNRQREHTEKHRRELQKRVFDLELKLSRSQNSTSNLIQERDNLIAELQSQLNTLVHNFEVSQKHIRVLRRHIYTMTSGGSTISNNREQQGLRHNRIIQQGT